MREARVSPRERAFAVARGVYSETQNCTDTHVVHSNWPTTRRGPQNTKLFNLVSHMGTR